MALTQEQIAIVKSTAPVLQQHGTAITAVFYQNLLSDNPGLKNMFSLRNQQTGAQQKALANSVLAYATYIDDLPRLQHAVERIAHKHASLFVEPAQYDVVGKYLMAAIGTVLGDALTPDIAAAWTAAYAQLAAVFIKREGELYRANGTWTHWRRFRIARREPESDTVTSFYLVPVDGVPLPRYLPGQYVSLQVPVPQLGGLKQSRQFSLSEAPREGAEHYRVSIKREDTVVGATAEDIGAGKVPGLVSNMLHDVYQLGDEVELSAPQGEFFVDPTDLSKAAAPLVLISAGVGATPMVAILDSVLASPSAKMQARPITWVQSSRSSASLCFSGHIRDVCRRNSNVNARVFVSQVLQGDELGERRHDPESRLDLDQLDKEVDLHIDDATAEYYICGPEPWMLAVRARLSEMGVDGARMHLELFATGDVPSQ